MLVFPEPIPGPRPKSIEGDSAFNDRCRINPADYQAGDPLKRVQWKRVRSICPAVLKESGAGGRMLGLSRYPGVGSKPYPGPNPAVLQRQGEQLYAPFTRPLAGPTPDRPLLAMSNGTGRTGSSP